MDHSLRIVAAPQGGSGEPAASVSYPGVPCSNCATLNPASFLFCQGCGSLLPRRPPSGIEAPPGAYASPGDRLGRLLLPISIDLVRAGRATLFDSKSIQAALATVDGASQRLEQLRNTPELALGEEFVWERNAELAECSSLIEGAGALLGMATAPETRDNLRPLFVRRAFWVLQVAAARTRALLREGER